MATAIADAMKAIYDALVADTQLMALVGGRVYDAVPDNSAYPYVAIGLATENRFDTFGTKGKDLTATIHVWSQQPSTKALTDIVARMDAALDLQPITIANWHLVEIRREFGETLKMPDGLTRQFVARYRMTVD